MILLLAVMVACHSLEGDRITGRDLAAANITFVEIDAAADLGPAPLPGLRRVMRAPELTRLAARTGITLSGPIGEACFDRPKTAVRASTTQARLKLGPPEVSRGDRVMVEVAVGAARLAFEAQAESSGHVAESIIVRNPESGKLFRARVEDKGKVSVRK